MLYSVFSVVVDRLGGRVIPLEQVAVCFYSLICLEAKPTSVRQSGRTLADRVVEKKLGSRLGRFGLPPHADGCDTPLVKVLTLKTYSNTPNIYEHQN